MQAYNQYIRGLKRSPWWGPLHELLPYNLDQAAQKATQTWPIPFLSEGCKKAIAARRCVPDEDEQDEAVLVTHELVSELTTSGSNLKATAIVAASRGDLSKLQAAVAKLQAADQMTDVLIQQTMVAAIISRIVRVVAYCLSLGAKLDDDVNWTVFRYPGAGIYKLLFPLNIFTIKDNPAWMDKLLDDTVSMGRYGSLGQNAATKPEAAKVAEFLLEQGAKPLRRGVEVWGNSGTVNMAARWQTVEYMQVLLNHDVKLEDTGALHGAALEGRVDMINFLLDNGADIHETIDWDMIGDIREPETVYALPLKYAVVARKVEAVRVLLERGADPSLKASEVVGYGSKGPSNSALDTLLDAPVMVGRRADSPALAAEIRQLMEGARAKFEKM